MINYMNKQNEPPLIISVESRKGGVGKTTAALCLARLLLKYGYSVLVMDLDVTGTNAADIADSPFWKEKIHVIKSIQTEGDNKINSHPINFLTLFEQCFMSGKAIPDFSTQAIASNSMSVNLDKVNVLGSQIYETNDSKSSNSVTCIERPSILFDDLHTLWMVEFVKNLTDNFVRMSKIDDFKKLSPVAIILDNSPGYVGISPSIHEWLTDNGPKYNKFITVMSLDVQDLLACERAINALHGLYERKWLISCLFKQAGKSGPGINVAREHESFFLRLATSAGRSKKMDPLSFYKQELKSNTDGDIFFKYPNKYTAAIINRVPRSIKSGNMEYAFPSSVSHDRSSFQRIFCGNNNNFEWRDRMVTYDEYIENQFLLQSSTRRRGRTKDKLKRLVESLENSERKIGLDSSEFINFKINSPEDNYFNFVELDKQLKRAINLVNASLSDVINFGFGHLARLIHEEWLPGSIVQNFRNSFSIFLRENITHDIRNKFNYNKYYKLNYELTNYEYNIFAGEIRKLILNELKNYKINFIGNNRTNILIDSLSILISFSIPQPMWKNYDKFEISKLLSLVLAIELIHLSNQEIEMTNKNSIQKFLCNESINNDILNDKSFYNIIEYYSNHYNSEDFLSIFSNFYRVCTSSQARIIDFVADSKFLIHLIGFVIKSENDDIILFPYIKGIAEEVIIKKTIRHEDAPKRMKNALQTAEYFLEYEGVLKSILTDWGIANV